MAYPRRMKILLLALCAAPLAAYALQDPAPAEARTPTFDHRMFDALLERHVEGDRVDYMALLKDRAMLDTYCERLEAVTRAQYAELGEDERFALWSNAYNAFTLQLILDHYLLEPEGDRSKRLGSIQDLSFDGANAWQHRFIAMGGLADRGTVDGLAREGGGDDEGAGSDGDRQGDEPPSVTLNEIENEILRPIFEDARVHFAVNCAASSCPPLRGGAFTGAKLDAQLDEQTRAFLADPAYNTFDAEAGTIGLSKIFEWYAGDFEDPSRGLSLRDFLVEYGPGASAEERAWMRDAEIGYLEYDWALNDVAREERR